MVRDRPRRRRPARRPSRCKPRRRRRDDYRADSAGRRPVSSIVLEIPNGPAINQLIGPKGVMINMPQQETGTHITVQRSPTCRRARRRGK